MRLFLVISLAWFMSDSQAQSSAETVYPLDSLVSAMDASGNSWLPFITVPTLQTGLYRLARDSEDRQSPHDRDEVYVVLEGVARMQLGDSEYSVGPRDTIFVKAGAEHRFFAIEEDLLLLVFFSEAAP